MRKIAVRLPRQLQQALQRVQSQEAAIRKAVSQQSTAGQHMASTCKQQPSTSHEEVQISDATPQHDVSISTTAAPKAGMPNSSTACMRKARAADASNSRQALTQQPQHSTHQKLRQQQHPAVQQSPAAQQQRRSFEQRLVAARATAAAKQSPGGYASGGSGVSPSKKGPRQSGTQQKASHEMFTVWHTSALFAAM